MDPTQNPQAPQNPNPQEDTLQSVSNPLKVMQQGERVICEVKRHPIGLVGIHFSVGLVLALLVGGVYGGLTYIPDLTSSTKLAIVAGAVIVGVIVLLYAYVAGVVYRGNRWIVTSDSLTQVSQVGLFRTQSSQLSLANLEDVSVIQNGLIQSMIGYGTLKVETAGEHSKFTFPYCPKPNQCAKEIIAAHEAYIAEKPNEMQTTNRALVNTASFNQSYTPPSQ